MINVMHIRSTNGFYGAERVITTLLPNLEENNIQVKLVIIEDYLTHNNELYDVSQNNNIDVILLECNKKIDLISISKLIKLAKNNEIKIIHTHDSKSNIYGWVVAKMLRVPIVKTLHGWTSHTGKMRLYEYIDRVLQKTFNMIILVSPPPKIKLNNQNYIEKYKYIPNGVDLNIFNEKKTGFGKAYWGIRPQQFTFGIFARFTKEKGHQNLIEAFAKAFSGTEDVCLLMLGSGPEQNHINKLINHHGMSSKIKVFPFCDHIDQAMHDIDCYVSPSHTEGMPMVLLEAMASGIPIIATKVGAVDSLIGNGAGLVVPSGDVNALSSALLMAYKNPSELKTMSNSALTRVQNKYSAYLQAKRYIEVYQELNVK